MGPTDRLWFPLWFSFKPAESKGSNSKQGRATHMDCVECLAKWKPKKGHDNFCFYPTPFPPPQLPLQKRTNMCISYMGVSCRKGASCFCGKTAKETQQLSATKAFSRQNREPRSSGWKPPKYTSSIRCDDILGARKGFCVFFCLNNPKHHVVRRGLDCHWTVLDCEMDAVLRTPMLRVQYFQKRKASAPSNADGEPIATNSSPRPPY